ncbi:MAG TPA: DUF4157 domain-containing protein [Gammaproteobacteria bacterium]|nr:DUF4157 domain-containing protein [Gammaproteobacteria bacterium]
MNWCTSIQTKAGHSPHQGTPARFSTGRGFGAPSHRQGAPIQAKLTVGAANDRYEQEADRVAAQVMRMPATPAMGAPPRIQRLCAECEDELQRQVDEEEEELVQAKAGPGGVASVPPGVSAQVQALRGGGQPLPAETRAFFEPRFGHDFSQVRVHADQRAAASARALNARAYTRGYDIAFGAGQYSPDTDQGRHLLAHELTHVVQQNSDIKNKIQRYTLENDPSTAPAMSCPVATSSPAGVSLDVTFGINSNTLSDADKAAVSNFVRNWHLTAVAEPVRVDGYASVDGPPTLNWQLSCNRAEALAHELMTPSDGSPGIPAGSITLFAQGETDQFSPSLAPNRRAQAHIPSQPVRPPTITSETVEIAPGSRTRTTIGVGERVTLTHSSGTVNWVTSAGTLSAATGATVMLMAPDTAQTVTVRAGGASIAFTVVAPTGVHMDRFGTSGVKHTKDHADSGIEVLPFLLPDTVNFSRVVYREMNVGAVVSNPGPYSCFNNFGHCRRTAGGACNDLSLTNTVVAGKGTQAVIRDCVYSGDCLQVAPFDPGSITFTMPYQYKVGGGAFRQFTTVVQQSALAADQSTLTSSKAGASGRTTVASATLTNPASGGLQCP